MPAPTCREAGLWQAIQRRWLRETGKPLQGTVAQRWRVYLDRELAIGSPSWLLYPTEAAWADTQEIAA